MGVTRLDIANCVEPGRRVAPQHAERRPSAAPRCWFTRRSGAQQCHELVERDQIIGVSTLLKRPIRGVDTYGSRPPRNRTARRKAMGLRNWPELRGAHEMIEVIRRGRVRSLVPGSSRAGAGLCRRQR